VSLFVTGTDTGVGKTHTVRHLLRLLRIIGRRGAGMKPICCGDRGDAQLLLAAGCDGLSIDEINPVWLKTPAAPLTAAEIENFKFKPEMVLDAFRVLADKAECVFVEGVGGWRVPITAEFYVSDLAVALGLPVLVVAQNRLGCLNHTLLTLESVRQTGLACAGVVLNELPGQSDIAMATNRDVLQRLCGVPVLTGLEDNISILTPEWKAVLAFGETVGLFSC
jgi:dethiobiotin synthetase